MTAFDTNILLYCCDQRDSTRQEKALKLVESRTDGVILWQVACEFVAASRKLAPSGLLSEEAWARLAEFLAVFPLVLPSAGVLDRARQLHIESKLSFWDSLIVAASLEAGVDELFSEDLPGRNVPGLRIVNPFA